jgi:hypothetical protein
MVIASPPGVEELWQCDAASHDSLRAKPWSDGGLKNERGFLSRRNKLIIARHEVPGQRASRVLPVRARCDSPLPLREKLRYALS